MAGALRISSAVHMTPGVDSGDVIRSSQAITSISLWRDYLIIIFFADSAVAGAVAHSTDRRDLRLNAKGFNRGRAVTGGSGARANR